MCRMLGIVAAQPIAPRLLLRDAPRSLQALSEVHKDGWGVALRADGDWIIHRSTACAARCAQWGPLVDRVQTQLMIAHIRQRTVGEIALTNTHPFRRGAFVMAHNGTVKVALPASAARTAEIEGTTDSEKLFAFVLSHVDELGDTQRGVVAATRALHALGEVGSASFLFSDGARLYAHRLGRTLYTLARPHATIVASEQLTDEAWAEVPEHALVEITPVASHVLAA